MTHHEPRNTGGASSPGTSASTTAEPASGHVATRVVLRPLATPLPLGFLALGIATFAFASVQLRWVPAPESTTIAVGILVLTVPLQLLAAVMGFLSRDPGAATGMGILSGTWGAVCLATLTSPPGQPSDGLGVILLGAAACLVIPAVAARTKAVPAAVIFLSALRFAVTGIAEIDGTRAWMLVAGWVGVALAAVSFYAALALELEGSESRTVLPLARTGAGRQAVHESSRHQLTTIAGEPGVRRQL